MSEYNETRLTEVDKLMRKIDSIYTAIKGDDGKGVDLSVVKDEFEKLRYEVNRLLSEADTLISKKDEIKGNEPREVHERAKLDDKINKLLTELEDKMTKMNTVLRSQKKKGDITFKEQAKSLIEERYQLLKNKHSGEGYVDDKKLEDNRTNLEKLDYILQERAKNPNSNREPNEIELEAMDRWKREVADQDAGLKELGAGVKVLKGHAQNIGRQIEDVGKDIKKNVDQAKKTEKKLETTNAKLKDLLNKLRSGDRICIDIILVLVCLGLIAVLYNIIKSKITSTTTSSSTTTKTFLYVL